MSVIVNTKDRATRSTSSVLLVAIEPYTCVRTWKEVDSKKFVLRFRFYWRPLEGFHFHWRGVWKVNIFNLKLYAEWFMIHWPPTKWGKVRHIAKLQETKKNILNYKGRLYLLKSLSHLQKIFRCAFFSFSNVFEFIYIYASH